MSNVLVVHPDDRSTDFLKLIYDGKGYDVVNFKDAFKGDALKFHPEECKEFVREQIRLHDKIIMLGHGTPNGLLNPRLGGYIVDDSFVDMLRDKECVSIWCYSDMFFRQNNIFRNEFHTGMIISETLEQLMMLGRVYLDHEEQLKNMELFGRVVGECIEKSPEEMKEYVLKYYVGDDPVTKFNRKNILVF